MNSNNLVILDFGSQYTQLIARKIRYQKVASVVLPCTSKVEGIKKYSPIALVFSGGPSSVYSKKKTHFDPEIFDLSIPILGICYGLQLLVNHFGGEVVASQHSEYGRETITIKGNHPLFFKLGRTSKVWMSHGDEVKILPKEFKVLASSQNSLAAIAYEKKRIYGLQFHPEVQHSLKGEEILSNFLFKIVRTKTNWSIPSFIENSVKEIRDQVGDKKVLLALSGGVDSSVLAVLLDKAIGSQLTCVFINNGFLREGEAEEVIEEFSKNLKISLKYFDVEKLFLRKLRFVKDPERKRNLIGNLFLKVFFKSLKEYYFLAQGTLYPDVIESVSVVGPSKKIKTHHNRVKAILKLKEKKRLLEPFAFLFKDEVREIGKLLKINPKIINRQPFPGPGLAIRIIGSVSPVRLRIVRQADKILNEEITLLKEAKRLWQAFAVLLPVKSVGVVGDKRIYGYTIVLRMVSSKDGMTADFELFSKEWLTKVSNRITGEVKYVSRVVLDITSKPPATIEWE